MKTTILLAVAAGAGMLRAQTASLSALSTVMVEAQLNGQIHAVSAPVGTLAPVQSLKAELGVAGSASHALSQLAWSVLEGPSYMALSVGHQATIASTTAATAEVVSCDLLFELSNPTPIQVLVNLQRWAVASAGVPTPIMRIDIGNDGSFELTETSQPSPAGNPAALGPTPLPVRVQYVGAIASPGVLGYGLQIGVTPVGVSLQQVAVGCDPLHHMNVIPTFDGGVLMNVVTVPQTPAVIVLGLSAQPVILPSSQMLPCLLIPSPDLLVLRLDDSFFALPIPPAVRPTSFFAQPVVIFPNALETGHGQLIYAQ